VTGDDGTAAVRGVLFDSGGVLLRPRGGRWNPRYDFEAVLDRRAPEADRARFAEAFAAGQRYLDGFDGTAPRDAYHRVILEVLGVEASDDLLAELDAPTDVPAVEPYPEVPRVLDRLAADGIAMAVVSDAWADLVELYERLGLAGYFEVIVISEVLGVRKPDPRMYRTGSDGLGLRPDECLFVDDDPDLVRAAEALGYQGLPYDPEHMTLDDVLARVHLGQSARPDEH
jgi:putative hydrolase of the HAD superfamily